ncbi:hypothetical protein KCU88_g442, partial [Aureobasidium melanogenum]
MLSNSGPLTLKKLRLNSVAMAFARTLSDPVRKEFGMCKRQGYRLHNGVFLRRKTPNVLPGNGGDFGRTDRVGECRSRRGYRSTEVTGKKVSSCLTTGDVDVGKSTFLRFSQG